MFGRSIRCHPGRRRAVIGLRLPVGRRGPTRRTTLAAVAIAFGLALPAGAAEISGLTARLAAADPAVRADAAWSLGDVGHEARDAVPALVEASTDPAVEVRIAAVSAMERIAAFANLAVPALIAALNDSQPEVRYAAAGALGQFSLKAGDIVPALIAALRDSESSVVAAAATGLSRMGAGAVRPLVAALDDGSASVRAAAAGALGAIRVRARRALPALIDAAIDRDPKVREAAVRAIGLVASAEETTRRQDSTTEFARSGEFPRAGWAARRMARVSSARREMAALALEPLLESLEDREEGVRYAAARAFAGIGIAANAAATEVAALVGDPSPRVRRAAARALGRIAAPRQAVGPLAGLLADEEMTVRWTAARALAAFGAEAQTALAEALTDDNAAIRAAAAVGLGEMGTEATLALLERARGDADPGVRAAAESALVEAAAAAAR